jgi:hypothetical protein
MASGSKVVPQRAQPFLRSRLYVRFGSFADIEVCAIHVSFALKSNIPNTVFMSAKCQ